MTLVLCIFLSMNSFWLLLILAVLAPSARAQDLLDRLPACAINCSSHFIEQIQCSAADKACLCTDFQVLMNGISACTGASCTVRDVLFSKNTTLLYCDVPRRDRSLIIEIITGVFGGIALVVVLLRIATRMRPFKAEFGWDDGLIISVMAIAALTSVFSFLSTYYGFGRDIFTIPPENINKILRLFYISESLYNYCIIVTKLSILCFYLRIFSDLRFVRSTYILMGISTAYLVGMIPPLIWQCTPISYVWTSWSGETEGHCISIYVITWIATALNILLDLTVILLPVPQILQLTLSKKKKIQIVAMFCVGLFVTLTSVVRLQSVLHMKSNKNFSWDYLGISYMSTLEIHVGIICACMPTTQLLLRRIAPRLFGSTVHADPYLNQRTKSGTRPNRNTNSYCTNSKNGISKTITTTVTNMPKDSDSTVELVDRLGNSMEGGSFATISTASPPKPKW